MFEDREEHVIETAARRLRRASGADDDEAFQIFNNAQDHVIRCAKVHIDRVVLEAFTAGIARCEDEEAADLLRDVCTLYALTTIEDDLAWFMGHNRLSDQRAKVVTNEVNEMLDKLRPHLLTLIEGLGVPETAWTTEMLPTDACHGGAGRAGGTHARQRRRGRHGPLRPARLLRRLPVRP